MGKWEKSREIYDLQEVRVKDRKHIDRLELGPLIRNIANKWFMRREFIMNYATFDASSDTSRFGVETWQDLEAELWIAYLEKVKAGKLLPGAYKAEVRAALENVIRDACRDGYRRRRVMDARHVAYEEQDRFSDQDYGDDEVLSDTENDMGDSSPTFARHLIGGGGVVKDSSGRYRFTTGASVESQKRKRRELKREIEKNGEKFPEEADPTTSYCSRGGEHFLTMVEVFQPRANIVWADGIAYLNGEPVSA